jgi:hypothetical protein
MNKTKVYLEKCGIYVELSDIECTDNGITLNILHNEEDIKDTDITIDDIEKEVGEIITDGVKLMLERYENTCDQS